MKRIIFSTVVVGTLTAAILGLVVSRPARRVKAQVACSNATLSVTYSGYSWGHTTGGSLVNSVSIWTFDGVGTVSGSFWGTVGGTPNSGTFSYNYSVNADCEGTIFDPATGAEQDHLAVASGGAEVFLVNRLSGQNFVQDLKKQ